MTLQILRFLLYYNNYSIYSTILEYLFKDTKELHILYNYLVNLMTKYNRDISIEEYSLFVLVNCQERDRKVLKELLVQLKDTDVDTLVFQDIVQGVQDRRKAYDIALTALEVSEGRKEFGELQVLTNNLNATESLADSSMGIVTHDLHTLLSGTINDVGLRWRLNAMNRMLGSLRKGNFGFIFARPETGKTTFLASEVSYFATQTTRPILWINNEEDGAAVELRIYQAVLGCTLAELRAFPDESQRKFNELGGTNIRLVDSATTTRRQVEQLCQVYDPALIVVDQLDKIKGFIGDREDLRLGSIYIWARELAKTYCPVIAVSQADVSGEGKKFLTMENVANAKTAKQAEADWILGIGATFNDSEQFDRYLHLSKNKLIGDVDTLPEMRHGKATVKIKPEMARYEDY